MNKPQKRNIIISIIIITGYTILTVQDKNATKEKATKVAIKHIKETENVDFVVTDVKIDTSFELGGSITVSGYDKNNKQNRFYVEINKIQNYKVKYWGNE
ncbi:hypothetical protein COJ48_18765 [Bacillus cereus]|nr:hypothetical protein COJ48_18765 [Bacillus cereus]